MESKTLEVCLSLACYAYSCLDLARVVRSVLHLTCEIRLVNGVLLVAKVPVGEEEREERGDDGEDEGDDDQGAHGGVVC